MKPTTGSLPTFILIQATAPFLILSDGDLCCNGVTWPNLYLHIDAQHYYFPIHTIYLLIVFFMDILHPFIRHYIIYGPFILMTVKGKHLPGFGITL